jgi:hypothetical protein
VNYLCTIQGCLNKARHRGWCNKHYQRWLRHGDTGTVLTPKPRGPSGISYFPNHRVEFSKRLWEKWWREAFDHPHRRYLEPGIAEFRNSLNGQA